ncbi:MAG: hypothetical protein ACI9EV_002007 [Urechidicola sp.]
MLDPFRRCAEIVEEELKGSGENEKFNKVFLDWIY